MEDNSLIRVNPDESYSGEVALPFEKEQLRDFIVGLLGKPQEINKTIRGTFEIDFEFVSNLFTHLEQRIHQQDDAGLVDFKAVIVYDNYSSVTLAGFQHFVSYNEVQPLTCVALHMTWQYLVKFRDKNVAEKQEISVSFATEGGIGYSNLPQLSGGYSSLIQIRIAHTARTWGADIEALLTRYLEPKITKPNFFSDLNNMEDSIKENSMSFLLILISTITGAFLLNYHRVYLLIFLYAITYAMIKLCNVIIGAIKPNSRPSYILITNRSRELKPITMREYRNSWIKFISATVGAILLSLLENYLFYFLTR